MATFAVINNGIIENCIVADSLAIAQEVTGLTCVEYTNENAPSIGWAYNDGVFINPNAPIQIEEEIQSEGEIVDNG